MDIPCDVFLLAAGLGTRLRPLTDDRPKPMVDLLGKPIIDWNLELLSRAGFRRVIINLFYKGEQIREHVGDGARWGLDVLYSEETVLLDTGGGIKNIEHLVSSEHLLTFNSDTVLGPDFDLAGLVGSHRDDPERPLATMVVRDDPQIEQYGSIWVDAAGRVVELTGSIVPGSSPSKRVMFAGVQVLRREIFELMPGRGAVFSITRDTLAQALRDGRFVRAFPYAGYWNDLGTPERLAAASKDLAGIFPVSRS